MKVAVLLENKAIDKTFLSAHGLSLYIESEGYKILFDLGPNPYYKKNAKKMDINLEDIDFLVLSHGHNDHGSGLQKFMKKNKNTIVVASKHIFEHYIKKVERKEDFIGIEKPSKANQITYVENELALTDTIKIYADVPFKKQVIQDNYLYVYKNDMLLEDSFEHEIYMVIEEDENCVLFSGCSHKGIENIIDTLEEKHSLEFTHVFAGFHFSHYDSFDLKETDYLINLGQKFHKRENTMFYTGHCTGDDAYLELKQQMKTKLQQMNTGKVFEI